MLFKIKLRDPTILSPCLPCSSDLHTTTINPTGPIAHGVHTTPAHAAVEGAVDLEDEDHDHGTTPIIMTSTAIISATRPHTTSYATDVSSSNSRFSKTLGIFSSCHPCRWRRKRNNKTRKTNLLFHGDAGGSSCDGDDGHAVGVNNMLSNESVDDADGGAVQLNINVMPPQWCMCWMRWTNKGTVNKGRTGGVCLSVRLIELLSTKQSLIQFHQLPSPPPLNNDVWIQVVNLRSGCKDVMLRDDDGCFACNEERKIVTALPNAIGITFITTTTTMIASSISCLSKKESHRSRWWWWWSWCRSNSIMYPGI